MHALLAVFLAIIAVNALLQAALVIGLAIGVRRVGALLGQVQDQFDRQVKPALDKARLLSQKAAEVSDGVLERAHALDAALADATEKLNEATDRVTEAVTSAAERLQTASTRSIPRPRGRAFALLRAVWRAVEVWSDFEEEPAVPRSGAARR